MINRRYFVAGAAAALALPFELRAQRGSLVMYHSPGCGCCLVWKERIEAAFGRPMRVEEVADPAAIKTRHGVPQALWSCHTAVLNGLVVEGHVPPADIRRAMGQRRWEGLAVAGMPLGSPGMDVGHNRKQPYEVIAFGGGRQSVFARHG